MDGSSRPATGASGCGSTRGVSNEMLAPVCRVEWDMGLLLIVHLFRA